MKMYFRESIEQACKFPLPLKEILSANRLSHINREICKFEFAPASSLMLKVKWRSQ